MIKSSITPKENSYLLSIPNDYIGKELEILIYAKEEFTTNVVDGKKKTMSDFKGILSDETAMAMHREVEESRNDWGERLKNQF